MKIKKLFALIFALIISVSSLTACGNSGQSSATKDNGNTAGNITEKTSEPNSADSGKAAASAKRADTESFTITDMGGRKITFDHAIKKAYAANPMGIVLIETMDFDKLGGYSNALSEPQKKFIPEKYWNLPDLGAWSTATPTANIEELVNANIDVILVTQLMTDKVKQMAENIQSQTGIPTVLIDTKFDSLADSYILLGELFNDPERGKMLSEYIDKELKEVKSLAAKIPQDKLYSVYYSEGADGLETDPSGSFHTETFDLLGLKNVADVAENTSNGFVGQSQVSLEQVIAWNPDYIIRNFSGTGTSENVKASDILASAEWAGIKAVKDGHVYQTPALPYNWIDRPPSVIRVLGVKWLGNLMYPDIFQYNIYDEAKEFFSTFFNMNLTDAQLDNILAESKAK